MNKENFKKMIPSITLFKKKKIIKGMNEIIDNQNTEIERLNKQLIEVYNNAASIVLGRSFKLETYAGPMAFWNGKKGIKCDKAIPAYQNNKNLIEVPVTFEGAGGRVYYWYFYKLQEENE